MSVPTIADDLVGPPYGPISFADSIALPTVQKDLHAAYAASPPAIASPDGFVLKDGSAGYSSVRAADAVTLAKVEALERVTNFQWDPGDLLMAAPLDLGARAVDVARLPRHSAREVADGAPGAPDVRSMVRWVRATELTSRREMLVPAVCVFLGLEEWRGERFWAQISTGTAAHQSDDLAVLSGLLEVIERDVIEIFWEQRLPLRRLHPTALTAWATQIQDDLAHGGIKLRLFDGTSEFGAPTIVGLIIDDASRKAARLIGCGTAATVSHALTKCIRELLNMYELIRMAKEEPPATIEDCGEELSDTSKFMALWPQRHAFDFLTDALSDRPLSQPSDLPGDGAAEQLAHLVVEFEARSMQIFATSLSNSMTHAVGLRVAHVFCPDLQPMIPWVGPRYRGHRRLYEAPAVWGYPVRPEGDLNPYPLPFA